MTHPVPSDELCAKARDDFFRGVEEGVEQMAERYVRTRDLPGLMRLSGAALWPREIEDYSIEGTKRLIARIGQAIAAVEVAGITDHYSYSTTRHMALLTAWRAEKARLAHELNLEGLANILRAAE